MSVTIDDVARRAGVDPDVAWRLVNARISDIDEQTRRGVMDAAAALGYAAPRLARSLGILFSEDSGQGLTHPFFILILNAFKAEAERRGYDVTFIGNGPGGEAESRLEHCRRRGVDGVCMVCVDFADPAIKALATGGLPCVTIDHIYKGVPAVLSDNETGVQKLVEYAISRGHRRIAFISGHNNSVVTRTRISQFRNTMAYHSLPIPADFVIEGRYHDIELTKANVKRLLGLRERPSCILLSDDLTYLGAQEAARELGLRIPEDISFAGYDGIPLTQALTPRLTTIRQSSDSIGQAAARRLIGLVENPENASRKPSVFPVELIEGGTVAEGGTKGLGSRD